MKSPSGKARTRRTLVLSLAILAAGCAHAGVSGVHEQLMDYRIASVEVSFYDEVDLGSIFGVAIPRLDLETDEEFAERVAGTLEATLQEQLKDSLPGQRPIDLRVRIETMQISSGVGRALLGSSSELTGSVALVEPATDETVAGTVITAREKAMGGNIGVLVNMAVAATSSRVDKIVERFSGEIEKWLEN